MNRLLFILFFLCSFGMSAQDSTITRFAHHKIPFGKTVLVDNLKIEFKTLSPDSRCPKEVTCIRGGEVIVGLAVYEKGVLLQELNLTFYPYGKTEFLSGLLTTKGISVRNLQLLPYPKADLNQIKSNYYLEFDTLISSSE